MVANSLQEAFDAVLQLPPMTDYGAGRELRCAAMNGFAGDQLRGMLGIAVGSGPFHAFGEMLGFDEPRVAHDFLGEIANLMIGHVARTWLARGVEITIGTPLVVPGLVFEVEGCDALERFDVVIDRPSGRIVAWLDLEIGEGFAFSDSATDSVPNGGDLLMF